VLLALTTPCRIGTATCLITAGKKRAIMLRVPGAIIHFIHVGCPVFMNAVIERQQNDKLMALVGVIPQ